MVDMEMEVTWLFTPLMSARVSACFFFSFCSCSCDGSLDAVWRQKVQSCLQDSHCAHISHTYIYVSECMHTHLSWSMCSYWVHFIEYFSSARTLCKEYKWRGMLLQENNQQQYGEMWPKVHYFLITACLEVFYSSTASIFYVMNGISFSFFFFISL